MTRRKKTETATTALVELHLKAVDDDPSRTIFKMAYGPVSLSTVVTPDQLLEAIRVMTLRYAEVVAFLSATPATEPTEESAPEEVQP